MVRKLDMTVMQMICCTFLITWIETASREYARGLDRQSRQELILSSSAKLNSLENDLGLKGDDFNTAVSILNVGFVLPLVTSRKIMRVH